MRERGVHEVAAGGVEYPLGFACRARCIEDKQRVLRAHLLRSALGRYTGRLCLVPKVAALCHGSLCIGALNYKHCLYSWALCECLVDIFLKWHSFAAAQALVGGDDNFTL